MTFKLLILIPIYISYICLIALLMFFRRVRAIRQGNLGFGYFKSYSAPLPGKMPPVVAEGLTVVHNHFVNQFQVPILFFITCLAAAQLGAVSPTLVWLGYLFVFTRVVHSIIHLGVNDIRFRALAYAMGLLTILAMWSQILLASAAI